MRPGGGASSKSTLGPLATPCWGVEEPSAVLQYGKAEKQILRSFLHPNDRIYHADVIPGVLFAIDEDCYPNFSMVTQALERNRSEVPWRLLSMKTSPSGVVA